MKYFPSRILFLVIISLAFCSENEKYTFVYDDPVVGNITKHKVSEEISFTVPDIGYIQYAWTFTTIMEYIGKEGDFYKIKATLTELENQNYINGMEILDPYRDAMEDKPCYLFVPIHDNDEIFGNDEVDHIKPVNPEHDYLLDAFGGAYMNVNPIHFKYPFSRFAVNVSAGDSWYSSYDSSKIYMNIGSPPSFVFGKTTWTLKKVKEKKGRKIAYVDVIEEINLEARILAVFLNERRLIVGNGAGKMESSFKWDMADTSILSAKMATSVKGDFEMDGNTFSSTFYLRQTMKKVK